LWPNTFRRSRFLARPTLFPKANVRAFGGDDVRRRHQVPHLFQFRSSHERHTPAELFMRIVDGQFLICRMQHPLAQPVEMVAENLRRGIQLMAPGRFFQCMDLSQRIPAQRG
jgi:hypothetical protein